MSTVTVWNARDINLSVSNPNPSLGIHWPGTWTKSVGILKTASKLAFANLTFTATNIPVNPDTVQTLGVRVIVNGQTPIRLNDLCSATVIDPDGNVVVIDCTRTYNIIPLLGLLANFPNQIEFGFSTTDYSVASLQATLGPIIVRLVDGNPKYFPPQRGGGYSRAVAK